MSPPGSAAPGAHIPGSGAASPRERILRAARRRLAAGQLPPLGRLALDAGVSRATLYRLIRSRAELLRILDVEPDASARERILTEALDLLAVHGLSGLSMDELAVRSGVSRASLYRLFSGKAALFRELVRANAPFVPAARVLAEHAADPPNVVLPLIASVMVRSARGREGLLRTAFFEISGSGDDAELARELALVEIIGPMAAYIGAQMAEGRLRPMHPLVALMAFVGPQLMHLLVRDVAERVVGFEMPADPVAQELAEAWLRAMAPSTEEGP